MTSLTVLREVDITGDGGIIKRVYREGEGDETPSTNVRKKDAHQYHLGRLKMSWFLAD